MMGDQMTIDEYLARKPRFEGTTFDGKYDQHRLESQYMRVLNLMSDGQWRSLSEIRQVTGGTEASISARLRDFRKPENGGKIVERRRRGDPATGLWEYRLLANCP